MADTLAQLLASVQGNAEAATKVLHAEDQSELREALLVDGSVHLVLALSTTPANAKLLYGDYSEDIMPPIIRLLKSNAAEALQVVEQLTSDAEVARAMWIRFPEVVSWLVEKTNYSSTVLSALANLARPAKNKREITDRFPKLVPQLFDRLLCTENELQVLRVLDELLDTPTVMTTPSSDTISLLCNKMLDAKTTDKARELYLAIILHLDAFSFSSCVKTEAASALVLPAVLANMHTASKSDTTQTRAVAALLALSTAAKPTPAQPVLPALMQSFSTAAARSERKLLSTKALHQLSRTPANHAAMRAFPGLVSGLVHEAVNSEDEAIPTYASMASMLLCKATETEPAREIYAQEYRAVADFLQPASIGSTAWGVNQLVEALRSALASKMNRQMFWAEYGSRNGFLGGFLPILSRATEAGDAEALENSLAILLQFSADEGGPAEKLQSIALNIEGLVARIDAARYPKISRTAKLLMLRLQQHSGLAALHAPSQALCATDPHRAAKRWPRGLLDCLANKDWDLFLKKVAGMDQVPCVLLYALNANAPLRVLRFLVEKKHASVNERMSPGDPSSTPLVFALARHRPDAALLFVEHAPDVHAVSAHGDTALTMSCYKPDFTGVTRRLVQLGSPLDNSSPGKLHLSALFACCAQANGTGLAQAHILLEAGASPHPVPGAVYYPLFSAAQRADVPMMKLLFQHGARAGDTTSAVPSTLLAMMNTLETTNNEDTVMEVFDLLVANGAQVEPARLVDGLSLFASTYLKRRMFPRLTQRWIEAGGDANEGLCAAAMMGRVEEVAFLLQLGGDPNYVSAIGMMSLHGAMSVSQELMPPMPPPPPMHEVVEVARLLIQAGANLDTTCAMDLAGAPLWRTINAKYLELTELLLQAGANKWADPDGIKLMEAVRNNLPSLLPWFDDGADMPAFDEQGGLAFVFTHCAGCRKRGTGELQACSGCEMVAYCGQECQSAHWKQHKTVCRKKQEMEAKRRSLRG